MNLQPLGDRLIVEVLEEEEVTVGGIVLPDTAREKPQRGKVLAVGPGARDEKGERVPVDVAEGDSCHAGNAELLSDLTDDLVERSAATAGVVWTFYTFPEDNRPATIERAREHQLLEHPIDPINRLIDVFED